MSEHYDLRHKALMAIKSKTRLSDMEDELSVSALDMAENSEQPLYEWKGQIYTFYPEAIKAAAEDGEPDCVAYLDYRNKKRRAKLDAFLRWSKEKRVATIRLESYGFSEFVRCKTAQGEDIHLNFATDPENGNRLGDISVYLIESFASEIESAGITISQD